MLPGEIRIQNTDDAVQIFHIGELNRHLTLAGTQRNLHGGIELISEGLRNVIQALAMLLRPGSLTHFGCLRTGGGGHELLGGAHRQPFIHDLLSDGLNLSLVTQRQEGAGMASRENPGGNATLHQGGNFSRRIVFEIWGRERPMRLASCS